MWKKELIYYIKKIKKLITPCIGAISIRGHTMKFLIIILPAVFSFNSLANIIDTPECEELKINYLQAQFIVTDINDILSIDRDRWFEAHDAKQEATEKERGASLEVWRAQEKLSPVVRRQNELLEIKKRNSSQEVIQAITQIEGLREELQTAFDNAESAHVLAETNKTLAEQDFYMVKEFIYAPHIVRWSFPLQQQQLRDELKLAEENADQQFSDFFICYEEVNQLPKKDCTREENQMVSARNKLNKAKARYDVLSDKFNDLNENGPDNMLGIIRLPATGVALAMRLRFAERGSDRAFESFSERQELYTECISETQQELRILINTQ